MSACGVSAGWSYIALTINTTPNFSPFRPSCCLRLCGESQLKVCGSEFGASYAHTPIRRYTDTPLHLVVDFDGSSVERLAALCLCGESLLTKALKRTRLCRSTGNRLAFRQFR